MTTKKNQPLLFERSKKKAERAVKDPEKTAAIVAAALEKARKRRGKLSRVWDDLQDLMQMIRAWARGEYKEVPWETLVLALGAVIYFLSPIDLIPDFIPIIGYLDDVTVVAFALSSIRDDLKLFRVWQMARAGTEVEVQEAQNA